jgi:hypothetical protein
VGIWEKRVARLAAFASRLAPTKAKAKQSKAKQSKAKQSSAAARGKAAPLNNERKLEYRF